MNSLRHACKLSALAVLLVLLAGLAGAGETPEERRFRPRRSCNPAHDLEWWLHHDLIGDSGGAILWNEPALLTWPHGGDSACESPILAAISATGGEARCLEQETPAWSAAGSRWWEPVRGPPSL